MFQNRKVLFALFVVLGVGVVFGRYFPGRLQEDGTPVNNVYDVASSLSAMGICKCVVPVESNGLNTGVYLTNSDKTRDQLVLLHWRATDKAAERWKGTVFVKEGPPEGDLLEQDPVHQLRYGKLLFYGDPQLLSKIGESLR
jgi:hypothetical protein